MDPNAAIEEIVRLAESVKHTATCEGALVHADSFLADAEELHERVGDLVAWLRRGGFPPRVWAEVV